MNKRANDNQITRHYNVRAALELMTNKTTPKEVFQNAAVPSATTKRHKTGLLPIKGRCYLCVTTDPKSDRKTRKICDGCKRPMCNTHSKTIAPRCTRCYFFYFFFYATILVNSFIYFLYMYKV